MNEENFGSPQWNPLQEVIKPGDDAPQMDCNFHELLEKTNLRSIQDFYWSKESFEIKILDLRDFWLDQRPGEIGCRAKERVTWR